MLNLFTVSQMNKQNSDKCLCTYACNYRASPNRFMLSLTFQESEAPPAPPPPAAPSAAAAPPPPPPAPKAEDKSKREPEPPPSSPQRNKSPSDPQEDKARLRVRKTKCFIVGVEAICQC